MVGELFSLHNLEILGDILINFEPLSTYKIIFEEDNTTHKKKKKQLHTKQTSYNDVTPKTQHELRLTSTM